MTNAEPEPDLAASLAELRSVKALATELTAAAERGLDTLERVVQRTVNDPLKPPSSTLIVRHTRAQTFRVDRDPELSAFVRARIDRMTFQQIEDAVAAHFPPGRRVSVSSIHRWFHATFPRTGT